MLRFLRLLLCALLVSESSGFMMMSLRPNVCNRLKMAENIDRRGMLTKAVASYALINTLPKMQSADAYNLDEVSQIALYKKTVPSVCYISTEYSNIASSLSLNVSSGSLPKGVGTGFVWDTEGHIVTNFHVINKADNALVSFGKDDYVAKLTGADPDKDIAVLKIVPKERQRPMPLGKNLNINIGQNAFAIGNPFGQEYTFTMGVISGKHRQITAPSGRKIQDVIQTDAAVNPGNSGGPLIDSSGRLIGMNTATYGMGVSSGVNFAVSVDTLKATVNEIIEFGIVQRAVLGIRYLESAQNKSGFPNVDHGVVVLDVPMTSPCYKAGLLAAKNNTLGDVIIGINENNINKPTELQGVLEKYKAGDKVQLRILRGDNKVPMTLEVVLGSFKVKTYSGLEYEERKLNESIPIIPLDIPLKDMAPKLNP